MQVAHRDSAPRFGRSAHRPGGIEFVSLLRGEEGRPDNFELIIATITQDFHTPRHRHNFDQLRVMLEGSFGFDHDRVQEAGTIGYFCEGTYYQQQGVGRSEALVLQSGGASGSGFMSFQRLYEIVDQLKARGEFHDGVFTWHDASGKKHNQDGYEAAWEAAFERAVSYPRPRYDAPVFFTPDCFNWLPQTGAPNVYARQLAQFHEYGLGVSQLQLKAGASTTLRAAGGGTELAFVYDGDGEVSGQPYRRHSAVKLDSGEAAVIMAGGETTVLRLRLPFIA